MGTRQTVDIAARRREVGRAYLAGKSQVEIASELNVSQSTISRDLKFLQEKWLMSTLVDVDHAKARELARLDALEITYWEAWRNSLKTRTEKTVKGDVPNAKDKKTVTSVEQTIKQIDSYGDPRFLQGVERCIDKRCQILGLDAPKEAVISWKSEIIYMLQNDIVSPDRVIDDFGFDLASELFRGAGLKDWQTLE